MIASVDSCVADSPAEHSPLGEKIEKLRSLFPELFSNGKIDLSALQSLFTQSDADTEDSLHFGLHWDGRRDAFRLIRSQSSASLRPDTNKSHDFDHASNVVVSGDNLEVMKVIQKAYFGAFKVIYMDPPYNVPGDFVYSDSVDDPLSQYLELKRSPIETVGKMKGHNTHSRWLTMMFPRLFVARNLMAEDGVIFVSIDDHEVHLLRMIMDDIFGTENFVCTFAWEKRYSAAPDAGNVGYVHENILCYKRSDSFCAGLLLRTEEQIKRYKNPDSDPRGPWKPADYTCQFTDQERPSLYYPIINPNTGSEVYPEKTRVWSCSKEEHERNVAEKLIWWPPTATKPYKKAFLSEIKQGVTASTLLLSKVVGHTDEAAKEMLRWFPGKKVTSKPTRLLTQLLRIAGVKRGDRILDCFAGTGTMAEAVAELNKADGKLGVEFFLIQIPEPIDGDLSTNMADLALLRAIECAKNSPYNDRVGVRFFELASSSFSQPPIKKPANEMELIERISGQSANINPDRSELDLLFEIMLKHGIRLTERYREDQIDGVRFFCLLDDKVIVCLSHKITKGFVSTIANKKPKRFICLDMAFDGNDQFKTNTQLEMTRQGVVFTSI